MINSARKISEHHHTLYGSTTSVINNGSGELEIIENDRQSQDKLINLENSNININSNIVSERKEEKPVHTVNFDAIIDKTHIVNTSEANKIRDQRSFIHDLINA